MDDSQKLVDAAGRFDSFLRHLPGFAWMKDAEGRYIYANSALQELLQYSKGWLGKTDADLWPKELADVYRENDRRVVSERKPLETLEPYVINGRQHYAAVSKFPIMDETGAVVMIGGAAVDITERERDAQRLREYEKVVEGAEEMISVVDREYRYQLANRAFLRYRRKERADVVGHFIWEVLDPDAFRDVIKPRLDECFAGRVVNFEMEYFYADSGARDLLASYFPIEGENGVDRVACVLQDITIRKRAEEALKQSQHQMAEAQRLAHVGSWTWDISSNTVTWSDELYRIYGLQPQEFPATFEGFLDCIHPEDRERTRTIVEEALRTCQPYVETRHVIRPDGEIRILEAHGSVACDESGSPVRMYGTSQDITERESAAAALREAQQKYRDILDNLHEGVFQTTPEGTFISANRALVEMLGFESEQELIESRKDIAHQHYVNPEDRDEFRRQIHEFGKVTGFEFEAYRKDRSRIWLSENVRVVSNSRGAVYYEGTTHDITERKRSQEALQQSEERYRELFENSRDAIYVHDLSGRYLSVNRAAEELSGYSREEIIGKHYSNFVLPTHLKAVRENFCRKLDVPLETTYETEIACKDGTRRPVEVSSRMIYLNGEPAGVQGTVRDITERKRAQRALRTYSRRLVNAQEAEREVIARELHDDIGQSLTAISINLESIHRSGAVQESAVPRLRESIDVIDSALRRVRELSFELRPALLDDLGLAAALTWYAARFSERTGIRATVTGELPGPEGIGRTVETACFRIVQEALTNTARYARASEASIHAERSNGMLKLTISDNGAGFAVDAFVGPGRSTNALGLRGMEERASAVGGRVTISSEQGKGTQVILTLPTVPHRSY